MGKKLVRSAKGKSVDPSRGKLDLKNQKAKYQITAPKGKVAQTNDVVLSLHYNVQPWVGVLTWTPQVDFGRWEDQGWCEQEVQVPGAEGQEGRGEKGEGLGNGGLLCCMLGFRSDRSDSGMAGIYGMLARK